MHGDLLQQSIGADCASAPSVEATEILTRLNDIAEATKTHPGRLSGALRVVAPFGYGRLRVAPAIARFAIEHPDLKITLTLAEVPWPSRDDTDLVIHIGAVKDSSWVAFRLASNERWLCASPRSVKQHGAPSVPKDLPSHSCICIRENNDDVTLWHFRLRGKSPTAAAGPRQSLRINAALSCNDGEVARQWAENGLGLVLRSQWDAEAAIAAGRLVRVLPEWEFDHADILALAPTRKGLSPKVKQFIECLRAPSPVPIARTRERR